MPQHAVARRSLMGVVIIVPAFAERQYGQDEAVSRIVGGFKATAAENVGGGVDQPGAMQAVDDAQAESPQEHGYSAECQKRKTGGDHRDPMIGIQPPIELMPRQIRRVTGHELTVVVIGFAKYNPAHVRPKGALARRMRIARHVGLRMVNAMCAHPEHRAAFERHGAAQREKVLEPARTLIRLMSVQAMIAETDPPSDSHPMQRQRHKK